MADDHEMADGNFDCKLKLVLVGDMYTGKTSFLARYVDRIFKSTVYVASVGIDFKVKTVLWRNKKIQLNIWDTAGQEKFNSLTVAYFRGAVGFVLMYDITDRKSFENVQKWYNEIKMSDSDDAQVILVGNKCDVDDERVVTTREGKMLANQLGLDFFEVSAKTNVNANAVFERLVDVICDNKPELLDSTVAVCKPSNLVHVTNTTKQPQSSCWC